MQCLSNPLGNAAVNRVIASDGIGNIALFVQQFNPNRPAPSETRSLA